MEDQCSPGGRYRERRGRSRRAGGWGRMEGAGLLGFLRLWSTHLRLGLGGSDVGGKGAGGTGTPGFLESETPDVPPTFQVRKRLRGSHWSKAEPGLEPGWPQVPHLDLGRGRRGAGGRLERLWGDGLWGPPGLQPHDSMHAWPSCDSPSSPAAACVRVK